MKLISNEFFKIEFQPLLDERAKQEVFEHFQRILANPREVDINFLLALHQLELEIQELIGQVSEDLEQKDLKEIEEKFKKE